jgi:hypothetical protein
MSVHARMIKGNLAYYDSHLCRILNAFGPSVVKFIEEFVGLPIQAANQPAWGTATLVGASTLADVAGADGGCAIITTAGAENDGVNLQVNGEAFGKMVAGKQAYFGCRFQVDEATQSDFLVGLCITDTDLLGAMTDGIYFRKVDGSTTMNFVLEKNSVETATAFGTAIAAATWYTVEFFFDGTRVRWWVNGVEQTVPATTNLCDDEWLTPSVHFLTGEAGAHTMTIDWIRAIQFN